MDLISKYELIEKIVQTDNEKLLAQVKHLLEEEEVPGWEELDPKLKSSINKAIKQADKGELTPHKKVMNRLKKKYLK